MSHNFISCRIEAVLLHCLKKRHGQVRHVLPEASWELRFDKDRHFRCLLTQSPLCSGKDDLATLTAWATWPSSSCPFLEAGGKVLHLSLVSPWRSLFHVQTWKVCYAAMPCLTQNLASGTLEVSVFALAWDETTVSTRWILDNLSTTGTTTPCLTNLQWKTPVKEPGTHSKGRRDMKRHSLEINFLIGTRTASAIRNSMCEHWRAKALSPMKRAPLFAGKPTDQANIFN